MINLNKEFDFGNCSNCGKRIDKKKGVKIFFEHGLIETNICYACLCILEKEAFKSKKTIWFEKCLNI